MVRLKKLGTKGFTLVELLIVVAIIGVLAAVGIPTYRKMVAKSKKSEAKVFLAGLYTAESAFFTEYNTYGSRLSKIGVDMSGNSRIYSAGFPANAAGNCADLARFPTAASALPAGYTAYHGAIVPVTENGKNGESVLGRSTVTALGGGYCAGGGAVGTNAFTAVATGNILPSVAPTSTNVASNCTVDCQDVWTIDQNRNLVNVTDGTN